MSSSFPHGQRDRSIRAPRPWRCRLEALADVTPYRRTVLDRGCAPPGTDASTFLTAVGVISPGRLVSDVGGGNGSPSAPVSPASNWPGIVVRHLCDTFWRHSIIAVGSAPRRTPIGVGFLIV